MRRTVGPPRFVIDTGLVLSALVLAQGRLAPLRHACRAHRIQPLLPRATTAALIRVLACPKFKLSANGQPELLADHLPCCETVRIPEPPPATPDCRDPFDVPFLQLALAGHAQALLTGDRDLLALAGSFACPILAADEFLQTLPA